jgi:hypothetical protein
MRAATIAALREYYQDTDDATALPLVQIDADGLPSVNPERIIRLLLRALREVEQDRQADRVAIQAAIQDLRQRVAALEA